MLPKPTETNIQHPMRWIPSTWFAMGFPFVALASSSAIMYKNLGISDTQIAFWTSWLLLPWTLKPLWAPFLEMYKTKTFFVYATQVTTACLFVLAALALQTDHFFALSLGLLFLVAFSGASHDMAADGVYLHALNAEQQARYAGWQGAFYNIAKIVSGGALVYLAGELEKAKGVYMAWTLILSLYGGIMLALAFYNRKVLPYTAPSAKVDNWQQGFVTLKDVVVSFFQKKNIAWGLAFLVLYRFAEGQAIKITPLFFKADRGAGGLGLSTSQIGVLYGVFGAGAFVLGSILAGNYVAKKGLNRKSLLLLCSFFNLPFAAYAYLSWALPTNLVLIGSAVAIEYFGYGFGFVGLILFIMQQIAPGKYKMAHYAFAGGLMNLGFMLPSMISGWLSDRMGYASFFLWVMVSTLPSFAVTALVPLKQTTAENTTPAEGSVETPPNP